MLPTLFYFHWLSSNLSLTDQFSNTVGWLLPSLGMSQSFRLHHKINFNPLYHPRRKVRLEGEKITKTRKLNTTKSENCCPPASTGNFHMAHVPDPEVTCPVRGMSRHSTNTAPTRDHNSWHFPQCWLLWDQNLPCKRKIAHMFKWTLQTQVKIHASEVLKVQVIQCMKGNLMRTLESIMSGPARTPPRHPTLPFYCPNFSNSLLTHFGEARYKRTFKKKKKAWRKKEMTCLFHWPFLPHPTSRNMKRKECALKRTHHEWARPGGGSSGRTESEQRALWVMSWPQAPQAWQRASSPQPRQTMVTPQKYAWTWSI